MESHLRYYGAIMKVIRRGQHLYPCTGAEMTNQIGPIPEYVYLLSYKGSHFELAFLIGVTWLTECSNSSNQESLSDTSQAGNQSNSHIVVPLLELSNSMLSREYAIESQLQSVTVMASLCQPHHHHISVFMTLPYYYARICLW